MLDHTYNMQTDSLVYRNIDRGGAMLDHTYNRLIV